MGLDKSQQVFRVISNHRKENKEFQEVSKKLEKYVSYKKCFIGYSFDI